MTPSLEDVFLDVVDRARAGRVIATVRAGAEESGRSPATADAAHPAVRAGVLLLLYGYALNFDIRNIALAVEDHDSSTESRALVSAFVNSGYFDLRRRRRTATPSSTA